MRSGGEYFPQNKPYREKNTRVKIQDNDVQPNQIIQITGHKNLQSINNYSSQRERRMENISNILSSTASTSREVLQVSRVAFHFPVGAPPFQHYQSAASSSTSPVHENQLQTMLFGNTITGGFFLTSLWPRHKCSE